MGMRARGEAARQLHAEQAAANRRAGKKETSGTIEIRGTAKSMGSVKPTRRLASNVHMAKGSNRSGR
eukprot:6192411-Pleurochrysis_carterae.AAC.1